MLVGKVKKLHRFYSIFSASLCYSQS